MAFGFPRLPGSLRSVWGYPAALLAAAMIAAIPLRALPGADFSPDQRKAIEAIIHDYLTKNPDVLLDALQAAEDKMKGGNDAPPFAKLPAMFPQGPGDAHQNAAQACYLDSGDPSVGFGSIRSEDAGGALMPPAQALPRETRSA